MRATRFLAKDEVAHDWYLVDATAGSLGRMASQIAKLLLGKHKAIYNPHDDCGDYVVVVNCGKMKIKERTYYHHTGYIGGIKKQSTQEMMDKDPRRVMTLAVKRMLPKGPRGYAMLKKLRCFSGDDHDHAAQNPKKIDVHTYKEIS